MHSIQRDTCNEEKRSLYIYQSFAALDKSYFCEFRQRIYISLAKRLDVIGLIHQVFLPQKSVLCFGLRDLVQVTTYQWH